MATLEDVLDFVRSADATVWNRIIGEMNAARRLRDAEAVRRFKIGDSVTVECTDRNDGLVGQIIKINHTRLILLATNPATGFTERVSVPAGLVRRSF